ncbi:hypothetical protein ACFX15_008747 [Malus domestica]
MVALFFDQTNEGRHFRQNIRAYNHAFAFTSMGVYVDERINLVVLGFTHFVLKVHYIIRLVDFYQMKGTYRDFYKLIYMTLSMKLKTECVNNHNPFVHTLQSLGQHQDLPNCKLILKEQPRNRRQYSLPSTSQVVAIIIDGDNATIPNGRDIVVETISGRLSHVQDYVGFYDPLQYPLLLPYGTYGWNVNSHDDGGRAITCCDYYAYMLQITTLKLNHKNLDGCVLIKPQLERISTKDLKTL